MLLFFLEIRFRVLGIQQNPENLTQRKLLQWRKQRRSCGKEYRIIINPSRPFHSYHFYLHFSVTFLFLFKLTGFLHYFILILSYFESGSSQNYWTFVYSSLFGKSGFVQIYIKFILFAPFSPWKYAYIQPYWQTLEIKFKEILKFC